MVKRFIAPPKNDQLWFARAYPAVHKGGISAVAMATPKITLAIVPFLVRAIINANPPKKAINTSRISGFVLPSSSDVSSLPNGKNLKNKYAVNKLSTIMVARFINDFFKVSISLIAIDIPIPKIGPINGDISIAPITTAVEFAFSPTEATKMEHINIQAVAPLKEISFLMASIVASRSVSALKSSNSIIKVLTLCHNPLASSFTACLF